MDIPKEKWPIITLTLFHSKRNTDAFGNNCFENSRKSTAKSSDLQEDLHRDLQLIVASENSVCNFIENIYSNIHLFLH